MRAWDFHKPLLIAPAMNTNMWQHPLTAKQLATVQSFGISTVTVISPITKLLACGDTGVGAMAEVADIADTVRDAIARPSPPAESSLALPAVIGHNPIGLLRPGDFVMRPNLLNNGASVRTKRIVQMSNEELCAGHWWPTYFYGPHNKLVAFCLHGDCVKGREEESPMEGSDRRCRAAVITSSPQPSPQADRFAGCAVLMQVHMSAGWKGDEPPPVATA